MVNAPQSSRRAGSQAMFPKMNIGSSSVSKLSAGQASEYFVTKNMTPSGEVDIKFNKRENASKGHYLVIIGAVGLGLWFLANKAEKF